MASIPSYQYSALPDSRCFIRLLALSSSTDELSASLETFPISEAPPYEALSYAWGDELPTSSLICNSASLAVTLHLLEGVRQIRDTIGPTKLWIDAICINQIDVDEKAGQIPLMTQIYSQATRVLVWLGPAADDSDALIDEIWPLLDKLRVMTRYLYGYEFVMVGLPAEDNSFWNSLARFWSRPWFERLWVLQEVILANDVLFVCGNRTVDFALLNTLSSEAYRTGIAGHVHTIAKGTKGYMIVENLYNKRQQWKNGAPNSLHLLEYGRVLMVREPVDRVYALHGIMEAWIRKSLAIDYSVDARREYWRLYVSISKLILGETGLAILTSAESCDRPPGMPSWVPNWNSLQPTWGLAGHFHAGFHIGKHSPCAGTTLSTSDSIEIAGFQLGTIVDMSILQYASAVDEKQLRGPDGCSAQNLKVIEDALAFYLLTCKDPEEESLKGFARTLIADTGSTQGRGKDHKYTQDVLEDFFWYRRYLSAWACGRDADGVEVTAQVVRDHVVPYAKNLHTTWLHRCIFVTDNSRIGLGSRSCQPGDVVCIFFSAECPFILRKVPTRDSFLLISEAYVDGAMYGEALDERDPENDRYFMID
ncbi:hypothetical protein H2201_003560 [Coniosporium apollinis]|uniref:Heterokaryon incompatibility domain-containing protein n=2 Tax=Coniosporium TaxID=2810619 RepID=A0ABQ9NW95_9PEZI|nr:hypothetical protein H2199_008070 [Cladosporium sp. JES 115]KAJ9666372.1 hypothetical protein H2201_003560 [Coniosporium apollinis]